MRKGILTYAIILLSFFSITNELYAQTNTDSLHAVWNDQEADPINRLEAIEKIMAGSYNLISLDSLLSLSEQQHDLAKKNNNDFWAVRSMVTIAYVKSIYRETEEALGLINEAEALAKENQDDEAMLFVLEAYGGYYDLQAKPGVAYSYLIQAINLAEKLENKAKQADLLIRLAWVVRRTDNYERAIPLYLKAIQIYEELGNQKELIQSTIALSLSYYFLNDYSSSKDQLFAALELVKSQADSLTYLGEIYHRFSMIYGKEENYQKAIENEKLAQKWYPVENSHGIKKSKLLMAEHYQKIGEDLLAKDQLEAMLKLDEEQGGKLYHMINAGNLYIELKELDKAISICLDAHERAKNFTHIKNSCECLYKAYRLKGDKVNALDYQECFYNYTDSIDLKGKSKKILSLEFSREIFQDSLEQLDKQRQVELKHQEEIRKKKQIRNFALTGGIFAFIIAGAFFSRYRQARKARAIIEIEKNRSDNLLLNILPAEVAEELKQNGKAEAQEFPKVSILFTDFVDFTKISEKLSATALVEEINVCFKHFDQLIEKYDIEKIKTIGDAYMAAGGLHSYQDSVKNTVLCALEMQDFVQKRKIEQSEKGNIAFNMRVGIHTGPVVAGIVGVKKFQYDIWGDTVNTASRMEHHCDSGNVNISKSTYEIIKDDTRFKFNHRGKVMVKGKGEIDMYFVESKD